MSVRTAILGRDASALPGKRDEDWRWTDLRGLIRAVPEASAAIEVTSSGPFDSLAEDVRIVANGGAQAIEVAAGSSRVVALRFVSQGAGAHAAEVSAKVGIGGRLVLLESYEGDGGYLAQATLTLDIESGATLERIILAADDPEGVSVSQAEVDLHPGASFAQTLLTTGARRQRIETHVAHPGGGAALRLDGVYLLSY